MNKLITSLREHTQPQHTLLESVTRLPQSLESTEDLRRVLMTFLGYYAALDPLLHEASKGVISCDIADRPWRSRVLRQDLIVLGTDDKNLDGIQTFTKLPKSLTSYQAWGIHYVIEGSALGGKVVSSHMKKHPSLMGWVGKLRFFNIYGPDTASRWKSFMAELEKLNPSQAEQVQIVEGAQMMFSTLTAWFQEHYESALIVD